MMRALLLVLLVLAPVAAADHVYSHRFVIEGRLLGNDGTPIPGRLVEFFAEGDDFIEPCVGDPGNAVTNQHGDFRFCFHKHDLSAQTRVGVRAGNASVTKAMDTAFRRSVVTLHEPNETGTPPEDWNGTHLIAGKVWRQRAMTLEGVQVFGLAMARVPVNVTLDAREGGTSTFQTETDAYGDFALVVSLLENQTAENVTVHVESLGHRRSYFLDGYTHRVTAGMMLPREDAQPVAGDFGETDAQAMPGTTTPRVSPILITLVALVAVGVVAGLRRKM